MQQTEYRRVIADTIRYNIGLIHGANASDKAAFCAQLPTQS